jgi:hypothetical protein
LEEKLSNSLRARVAVETAQDGNSGRFVINFGNPEELNELIRMMGQVTGDASLQDVQMATPKSNILNEEQKIQTASGFALNTGFLNDVSVDDDKGELLAREEIGSTDPVRFGFNPGPADMEVASGISIDSEISNAHDSSIIAESFDSKPAESTSIELAQPELSGPPTSVGNSDSPGEFIPLSQLLAQARGNHSPLDSGSIEAYEAEHDMSIAGQEDDELSIQEQAEQSESTGISDAELDNSFKPATVASAVTPDLYSALFNI